MGPALLGTCPDTKLGRAAGVLECRISQLAEQAGLKLPCDACESQLSAELELLEP